MAFFHQKNSSTIYLAVPLMLSALVLVCVEVRSGCPYKEGLPPHSRSLCAC